VFTNIRVWAFVDIENEWMGFALVVNRKKK